MAGIMNLVIDIGNTAAKLAAFREDEVVEVARASNRTLEQLPAFAGKYPFRRAIMAAVIDLSEEAESRLAALPVPLLRLDCHTPLPIKNGYETPLTLGYDRVAAVAGAHAVCPGRDLLVVDAGTCITYEFIDAEGCYRGGNISPGVEMRFKALHQFTGRLPLVCPEGRTLPLGKDTETAIRAGVLKGIEYEIAGYIASMRHKYPGLLAFLTGGNDFSFDTCLKSVIFADKFLVLKGLNRILTYNNDRI